MIEQETDLTKYGGIFTKKRVADFSDTLLLNFVQTINFL